VTAAPSATPASDEAVGELQRRLPDDGNGDEDAYNRGWNAALAARTAAPAEQSPELRQALGAADTYALGPLSNGERTAIILAAEIRRLEVAARLAPIAPDARSVDDSELVEAALVDSSDAWTDEDAAKPWGCEIAFLRHLANDQAMGVEKGAMLRHCAKRIEATADAPPLARSVDGLSGEDAYAKFRESVEGDEIDLRDAYMAGLADGRRLAGAKVQSNNGDTK
jgi:hypothetical protein